MYKYLIYITLAFSGMLILFSGCGRSKEKAMMNTRLDSLENVIKTLESDLQQLDPENLKTVYLGCKEDLEKLHQVFQKNPLRVKENTLLQYEALKISLNKLVVDVESIDKEVQLSHQQLNEWRINLNKKGYSGDDFNQYLKTESGAMYTLGKLLNGHKETWAKDQELLNQLNPEVGSLIGKK